MQDVLPKRERSLSGTGSFYEKAGKLADVILVEADGSKRLPVKVPGPKEPVIPENSDQILCIYGLGALGKQAADCCFRMQPSEQLLKIPEDQKDGKWIMTEEKNVSFNEKGVFRAIETTISLQSGDPGL